MNHARPLRVLLLVLLLAACSGGQRLQRAGDTTALDLQLTSALDWTRIRQPRSELWTIDGPDLNLLRIYSRIRPGEHVFQRARRRASQPDGPWFRPDMRADELRDLVLDGLREEGAAQIDSDRLRPHRFGDVPGLRFDFAMSSPAGLRYRGTAAAAVRAGQLTVVLWYAPTEYYYGRDIDAVNRMLDGLRFTP